MPDDEAQRLAVLRSFGVLDTPADAALDRITALAQVTFEAPIALISLIDDHRQWFKSHQGLTAAETPREDAFCAHALPLDRGGVLVVEDATADARFCANPLVTGDPNIRFYAGAVLTSSEGLNLGTLCVIDTKPRPPLTALQAETLGALARLVMSELEVGRARRSNEQKRRLLDMAEAISGVGHWRYDVGSGVVTWSEEVYRIHGVDAASFNPALDSALGFYDDVGRDAVETHLAESIRDAVGFSFELNIRRSDGERRTVVCKATCECGGQGEVIAVFGVFQDITEHASLLRQVTEDRERFRLLTDNATDVIATYGPDGTFTYLSPAIEKLVGRSAELLIGAKTYTVIDPRDHDRVTAEFGALLASGDASRRIEYRVLWSDGSTVWVEAHPRPTYGPDGRLTGFQDVVRDVSARRAAQDAALEAAETTREALVRAQESEARYRLLADNANDMISTSTLNSTLTFVTPAVRRLLGYEPEEIIGRKTMDLTHPDDLPRVKALFERLILAGPTDQVTPYQFRGRHKSGEWVWLEGQPRVQFGADGTPLVFQDVVRDIAERREAEETANRAAGQAEEARAIASDSEHRYRLLAENASDMITRCSLTDSIKFISPSCERILGYTADELIGAKTLALIHPEDVPPLKARYERYVAEGPGAAPVEMQFRVRRKDGVIIWLEGRPKVVFDETGKAREIYDVVRDITARKALEAELEDARLAAEAGAQAKTDFLANMSHEIRTPLHSIVGFSKLLSEAEELTPEHRRQARLTHSASRSLVQIVDDILDFSKFEAEGVSLAPEPVDLAMLVEESVELVRDLAVAKGVTIESRCDAAIAPILADPLRLRQVMLNLLGNAVKFTAAGSVVVSANQRAEGGVRIAVTDTGIGIAPERLKTVFDRFAQADASTSRRFGGTGLGLAICRSIVQSMAGEIGVDSVEGEGSTFWFEITPQAALPATAAPLKSSATAALEGLRVLLADDNESNRELFAALMAGKGLEITYAVNGADAVLAVMRRRFDIVLMDVQMPVMDGLEATRTIRRAGFANLPIIALTANVMQAQIELCREAGLNDHLPKPYTSAAVLDALSRWAFAGAPQEAKPAGPVQEDVLAAIVASIGAPKVDGFMRKLAEQLRQMQDRLGADAEPEGLSRQAHSVRGFAATLGFSEVADAYQALESACRDGTGEVGPAARAALAATEVSLREIEGRLAA